MIILFTKDHCPWTKQMSRTIRLSFVGCHCRPPILYAKYEALPTSYAPPNPICCVPRI